MKLLMKVIPAKVARVAARQLLVAKKNSPHIFFGLGIVGSVASTFLACRATLKLSDTLDGINKEIDQLKPDPNILVEDPDGNLMIAENPDKNIDTIYVYGKASLKLVKLYAPSAIIGVLSIAALTSSHVSLARRNTALMAAYATVSKAFEEYRNRVRAEVGEEREIELYHGGEVQMMTDKDGNEIEGKVIKEGQFSQYAKFFDEYSKHWKKDPEYNRIFIQIQERYFNGELNWRGHVFLNEVYDALDIPRTKAGQVVGWVRKDDGDSYISFGVFDAHNGRFVNGWERSILLDFNVDGVIYDLI